MDSIAPKRFKTFWASDSVSFRQKMQEKPKRARTYPSFFVVLRRLFHGELARCLRPAVFKWAEMASM